MWFNKETDVNFEMDSEITLSIEATIGGKYIRATHWQPAEYPSVDSVKVMFGKGDVTDEIDGEEMERIHEQAEYEFKEMTLGAVD